MGEKKKMQRFLFSVVVKHISPGEQSPERERERERERAARGGEKNVAVILVNPSSGELGY